MSTKKNGPNGGEPNLDQIVADLGTTTKHGAILADPPWRFTNRTGKIAPEHKRLNRYSTMSVLEIAAMPIAELAADKSHLYLWIPTALIADGIHVMRAWGFRYVTSLFWHKIAKNGTSDCRCCGFYFRNVVEICLFGVRGRLRTLGRNNKPNLIAARKREHSRKPDEFYDLIEARSPGPYLEVFARFKRPGWTQWGNQIDGSEK